MKILFISANRIGDAILSTGLLRHLADTYPSAEFTVACGPLCVDLFEGLPGLEQIIPMPKQSWNRHWWHLWRRCAPFHWDIIVDLRNSLVSRLLRHGKLYLHRGGDENTHKVLENAAVMALAPPPAPKIWVSAAVDRQAADLVGSGAPIIALGPAANWYPKQWPAEKFAALVATLLGDPALAGNRVMVLAAAHERDAILPVLNAIPASQRIEIIGGSLSLAAACLQRAKVFIGNDSGLMHLAAAMGVPTLGLFGPGYEKIYGPWGGIALRTPESTAELLARLPHPGAAAPNLMDSLPVATVVESVQGLLKNRQ
ncbi:MAG: glycosyltransferase family 9 protein [Alphaproteobacteria bacterium]